jgi:predicted DNA-binding protein YlxM (UPF0122 family)
MKLSKQKIYAINWLYTNRYSIEDIAKELNIKIDTIQDYITNTEIKPESVLGVKSQPVKSSKDLMIRHTKEKKTNNVSIMTREASSFNDNAKKNFHNKDQNISYIYKPNK